MKPTNKLTELACKKANAVGKKLTDGNGMYLLVHKNGSKYWRMDYRFEGKRKTLALGVWPETTLTKAREMRDQARILMQDKIDPLEQKKKLDRIRSEDHQRTFALLTEEWMKRQTSRWTEKHTSDVKRSLENHVFPDLGDRPINEIQRSEVLQVLRKLEGVNKYEATHRARQRIEAVFNFAIITGDCENNPAAGLTKALTPPTKKKMPSLKPEELPEFLSRLEDYQGHRLTYLAMKFMLYTFVRTKELRAAKWIEFDLKEMDPTWKIPPERMKMKREHVVPLSNQVVEVLRKVSEISGDEKLVFPCQQNPKPLPIHLYCTLLKC